MRFRWKLLILLLTISLVPVMGMRFLGTRTVRLLGDRAVSQIQTHLLTEKKIQLQLLVDSYSAMLGSGREHIETALMFQAREVEHSLARESAFPSKVYFAEDFDRGRDLPPDTTTSPEYVRLRHDNEKYPLKISYIVQVFKLAPGVARDTVNPDIARLSAMTPFYQKLAKRFQGRILWQYTSLANGLHSAYPGHSGIPGRLDPREQHWFKVFSAKKDLLWSQPYVDPETRQIVIAASMPVRRTDGEAAGVTAMVMPVSNFLDRKLLLKNAPTATRFFMCTLDKDRATGERKMPILAIDEYTDVKRRSWCTRIEQEWLNSGDIKQFQAMMDDLEAGVGNVRRMTHQGCDCLWVYGPILPGPSLQKAFLVLITPYSKMLKPAYEAKENVQDLINNLFDLTRYGIWGIVLIVVVVSLFFAKTVTKPIRALEEGARLLGNGHLDARVDIRSRDEFGDMGRVFNSVVPRLEELYHLRQSMALAMEVQQNLLPKADPKVQGLDIAGKSIYCDETGGDYYDYIDIGEYHRGRIEVVVGDVSEHGIPSALLMTTARAILRQRSNLAGDIEQVISDVNRQLTRDIEESGQFMSLFYCEIDVPSGYVRWVRAGHDPAIVYDEQTDRFDELKGQGGIPLGVFEDYAYQEFRQEIAPGQIILIGTDGIWESQNPKKEMFGKEAFKKIIRENAKKPAKEILAGVIDALAQFRYPEDQHDDVTLVVIKVEGNA